jgi:hypothetical protein
VVAFALGADMVNVGREAMLAIGCIQAQKCHTDTCPTGVATQNKWLSHGLDPTLKSVRAANYVKTLRRDLLKVAEAAGVEHPGLIGAGDVEILTGQSVATATAGHRGGRSRSPGAPVRQGSCNLLARARPLRAHGLCQDVAFRARGRLPGFPGRPARPSLVGRCARNRCSEFAAATTGGGFGSRPPAASVRRPRGPWRRRLAALSCRPTAPRPAGPTIW